MGFRKADNENAVRVGWARDEDNEVIIDGYNALIQITTDDGTSGFEVQNSIGATSFLVDSGGDGYFAKRLGIGTENPETQLEVIGKTRTDELQVTSGASTGYVLTSDADGNATWMPSESSTGLILDGYVRDETFQENKNAQEEINRQILVSIDGYAQNSTVTEHYAQFSQFAQDVVSVIDGYSTDTEFYGLTNTVTENNNAQQQINQNILQSLDGYAQDSTESEHYRQLSQAIQDIVSVIDGYSTDAEFAGLNNTVTENNNAQQQTNQSILQSLDGYETKVSAQENYTAIGDAIQTILKDLDGYETKISAQDNYDAIGAAINTIRKDLEDAYADISGSASDGYIAFFTGPTSIAGDNDLYFDRVNNQLQVSAFKITTTPVDGYVLTSDGSGNATWQENISSPTNHRAYDQLVHNIAETSYETYTYSGSKITNVTTWTSAEMVTKIREEQFAYDGSKVTTAVIIQYDSLGVAVETITESYTYSGTQIIDITRTLT